MTEQGEPPSEAIPAGPSDPATPGGAGPLPPPPTRVAPPPVARPVRPVAPVPPSRQPSAGRRARTRAAKQERDRPGRVQLGRRVADLLLLALAAGVLALVYLALTK
jgi:hypothetical protein